MDANVGNKIAEGRTAEIFTWGDEWVVKLYREGWNHETAAYEYKQAIASQQTGYRVPQVQQKVEVNGRHGIVYERIEGRTMLEEIMEKPLSFVDYAGLMADLHLDMHKRRAEGMRTSQDILTAKIMHAPGLSPELKEKIIKYLAELPTEHKLLHGDFHPDNIMMTADGPVIIDWIDGNIGHPLADVARTTVLGRIGIPPSERFARILFRVFLSIYSRRYFKASPYKRSQLKYWLLPVAAGRLSEEIPHEKEALIAWVNRLANKLL